jgi:hypothetical protein
VAFTSTRVMGTCSVMGQAVGTAAALCIRQGLTPRQLYQQKDRLRELQQRLLRDDQSIRGLRNEDPRDVARRARVSASGERGEARAANIINGQVRDIPGREINHWAGPMGREGAWIELGWDQVQTIREIQITFDTGFQRELMLTGSDSANRGNIRGPQPETVRDYTILCRRPGDAGLVRVAAVSGNHQRLRRHRLEPVEAQAIRVQVSATNGEDCARIFEVRCYG